MVDAAHPGADGLLDRPRRVGVHQDVGAPVLRRLHTRAQFGLGVLGGVDRVVRRRHPAPGHDLDLAGPAHQLLAHTAQHLGHPVGYHRGTDDLRVGEVPADATRQLGNHPEVTVAGGLGNEGTRGINARARGDSLVNRTLEAEHRAADVADGGESPQQGLPGRRGGLDLDVARIRGLQCGERQRGERGMVVRIDQARHEHPPGAVDDDPFVAPSPRPFPRGHGLRRHGRDRVAPDQDVRWLRQARRHTVEDPDAAEQHVRLGLAAIAHPGSHKRSLPGSVTPTSPLIFPPPGFPFFPDGFGGLASHGRLLRVSLPGRSVSSWYT